MLTYFFILTFCNIFLDKRSDDPLEVLQSFSRLVFAISTMCDVTIPPMSFDSLSGVQTYLSNHDLVQMVTSNCPEDVRNVVVSSLNLVKSIDPDNYEGLKIATGLIQFHISSSIGKVEGGKIPLVCSGHFNLKHNYLQDGLIPLNTTKFL